MLLIQWFRSDFRLWLKIFQNRHRKSTILMIVFRIRFEFWIKFENHSLIIFRARVILNDVTVWIFDIVHENFFDFFFDFFFNFFFVDTIIVSMITFTKAAWTIWIFFFRKSEKKVICFWWFSNDFDFFDSNILILIFDCQSIHDLSD